MLPPLPQNVKYFIPYILVKLLSDKWKKPIQIAFIIDMNYINTDGRFLSVIVNVLQI